MESHTWSPPMIDGSDERVFRTTDPFILPGRGANASTVLYLVHGFTGSPSEFRRLGYYLNDQGYTVNAILLPGHGTAPEDMIQTGHRDWWSGVRQGYEELRREGYSRIIPIGHSMGGLLSLKLAMEENLPGVISLSTPIHLGSRKLMFAGIMKFFVKYVSKQRPPGYDPSASESRSYDKTPVVCAQSFRRLLLRVKKELYRVKSPLFIAQGGLDRTTLPKSAPFIYGKVSSPQKEIKLYPNSTHSILLDRDKDQVYEDISRFVARLGM